MPMWKTRTTVTYPSVLPGASWFSSLLLLDLTSSAFNYTVLKGSKIQSKAWEEGDQPGSCFSHVCADPSSNHPAHHRQDSKPTLQEEAGPYSLTSFRQIRQVSKTLSQTRTLKLDTHRAQKSGHQHSKEHAWTVTRCHHVNPLSVWKKSPWTHSKWSV